MCVHNGDEAKKALFPIYGINPGDFHASIPDDYFKTPPAALSNGEFEALRVSLTTVHSEWA